MKLQRGPSKATLGESNKEIYESLRALIPDRLRLDPSDVDDDYRLIEILLNLHPMLDKFLVNHPHEKAIHLLCISRGLNNRVASEFIPEDYDNIKLSTNLQKISLAYCKTALAVYNDNSLTLESYQVDDLNYWYNVIDTNLNIISSCNAGQVHGSESSAFIDRFGEISDRIEVLIKKNPKPEYYSLQSLLYTYMGKDVESRELLSDSLKGKGRVSLSNITESYYRESFNKGKYPVIIYI